MREQDDQLHPIEPLPIDPAAAIKRLYERYQLNIFNICLRLLGNQQEAEDVTQDVFVRAFNAYGRFRGDANPGTWLYRIAVNLCLNLQRRQKQLQWLSLDFFTDHSEGYPLPDHHDQPEEIMQKAEMERIVQEAINRLPERQRVALVLSRYEDLSYQEIAETMDCSVSSVESLLHRAKQNLVKRLWSYRKDL